MRMLKSGLSLPESVGLSLALISPTVTAAFNITLVVQAAGRAAPLTFAIGALAMSLVALSFMAFTRRVAHAGSAYAYVAHSFGSRVGFVAGWTLLLSYAAFTTGFAALVGSFTCAALKAVGIEFAPLWLIIGVAAMLVAWWLAHRDMRLAGRLMLALEAAAVAAIIGLCISIVRQVHPSTTDVAAGFEPSANYGGWPGLGFAMVFSILCFAGFEGAATLGEETLNPRRNIPIALLGSVLFSALFFMFVAFCEVIGYGQDLKGLANSEAPLNDLALRYASPRLALALDLAAAISCFSGILGGLAAGSRILFALARVGLAPALATVHPVHGTPARAVAVTAALIILPFILWAPFAGAANYYSALSTIGVLALILIYMAVGAGETLQAWGEQRRLWAVACALGPLVLLWVLYRSVYPVPDYPNNLWPYVALSWVLAAVAVMKLRPAVASAPLPDYS